MMIWIKQDKHSLKSRFIEEILVFYHLAFNNNQLISRGDGIYNTRGFNCVFIRISNFYRNFGVVVCMMAKSLKIINYIG